MKDPYSIIVRPLITEKAVALSHGDPRIKDLEEITHKYTFVVALDSNKLEIKDAIEAIYNKGKGEKDNKIKVVNVSTLIRKGKSRRVGQRKAGKRPDIKKAIVTLAKGQILEDYGV